MTAQEVRTLLPMHWSTCLKSNPIASNPKPTSTKI